MESVGARLKKLRLEKGINLQEVYKKTKIHMDILRAIEDDSFINLSPVYIRGFLRIYCEYLGIDPKDYISDYQSKQAVKPVSRDEPLLLRPIKLAASLFTPYRIKSVFIGVSIIISVLLLFNLGRRFSSRKFPSATSQVSRQITPAKAEKKGQALQASEATQKTLPLEIRLGLRTKEDCFVKLKTDGRLVFEGVLKRGRLESWSAKDKIELYLGNAGAVELEVNGKVISSLGRRGQTLKNILITKEGLSIDR
jgi:cytoskeletal protein RodZ